jgi:hypothetical protein
LRDMRDREEEDSFSDASSSDDDGSDSSTDGFGKRIQNAAKKFPTSRVPAEDAPGFAEDSFRADVSSDDSDSSAEDGEGGDEGVGEDDDEDDDENDDEGGGEGGDEGGDVSADHYDESVVGKGTSMSSVAPEVVAGSSVEEPPLPTTIEGLKSSKKKSNGKKKQASRRGFQLSESSGGDRKTSSWASRSASECERYGGD